MPIYNKYKNTKVYINGVKVGDSKGEFKRLRQLELMEGQGLISGLKQQVKFKLVDTFKDNQGNTERGIGYIADFVYKEKGFTVVEDFKSKITAKNPDYIIKRKLFKLKYPGYIFFENVKR